MTRSRKLIMWGVMLFLVAAVTTVLLELGGRLYIANRFHTTTTDFSNLPFEYYGELRSILADSTSEDEGKFSILLLGGSVLHPNNGQIEEQLQDQLSQKIDPASFKIYNAATPGHSTMDSYLKLQLLQDRHFDLVILYHGINEVRANNCPASMFESNYSHYSWYDEVLNAFEHKESMGTTVLPFLLGHIWIGIKQSWCKDRYVPRDTPKEKWLKYGKELKTPVVFHQNTQRICELATEMGATTLIPTFVHYLAPGYNRADLEAGKLDYDPTAVVAFPIEIWGTAENVIAGIRAHNEQLRSLANKPGYEVLDLASTFPKSGQYFDDVCHLSQKGSIEFVEQLMPSVLGKIQSKAPNKYE